MPFVSCPVCGDSYHLLVQIPLEQWEAEHITQRSEAGVPLLKCIRCWVELRMGHKVTVRSVPVAYSHQIQPGDEGVVISDEIDNPERIRVSFGLIEAVFCREDLFYVIGQGALVR